MNEMSKDSSNKNNDKFLEENKIIFKKYKPLKKIDKGAFGNIYSVISLKDKNIYAMKTEKINAQQKTLESEAYYLVSLQGGKGIPKFITFGHTKNYNILIETLLDKSLYSLFIKNQNKCSIIDVCLIGRQIIERLEWIHYKNFLYRDIKPENFLIGRKDPNKIYVVDFGLCKKYRSSKTGKHIQPKVTGRFNGTLIYASPNVVKGMESSRRDDLISLGYMLIYLLKRNLPWESNFLNLNKAKYHELIYLKDTNGCNKLFNNIPKEFADYINYSRKLKFEENPNYAYLRSLFDNIIFRLHLNLKQLNFSWLKSKNSRVPSKKKPIIQNIIKGRGIENTENSNEEALTFNRIYNHENKYNNKDNISNPKNINNIYSEKVFLNNNNNININNINLEKVFLNNNKINLNNINSERIFLNNKDIDLNEISEIINLDLDTNINTDLKKQKNVNKKNMIHKQEIPIINFNTSNVISERINFKNIHFNTTSNDRNNTIIYFNNNNNNNINNKKKTIPKKIEKKNIIKKINKSTNKNNNNIQKVIVNVGNNNNNSNLSNNIFYKSPLFNNKDLLLKISNNNEKKNIKNKGTIETNRDLINKNPLNYNKLSSSFIKKIEFNNDNNDLNKSRKRNYTPNYQGDINKINKKYERSFINKSITNTFVENYYN